MPKFDIMTAFQTHPEVFFDVISGSNGAYRAGPGRDETTGFGVPDGSRLFAALKGTAPAPGTALHWTAASADDARTVQAFTTSPTGTRSSKAKAALARGSWS